MGPRMRTHHAVEGGTVYLLVGPRGVTEWAAFAENRAYSVGISPRFNLAKRNADIQGC
jgi:hypothetical protein